MNAPSPLAYRLGDAAKRLGVSRVTLWRRIKDGQLPTYKLGSMTLIPANALPEPKMQPGCSEPEPYAAVRSNPVVGALSAAHTSDAKRPGTERSKLKQKSSSYQGRSRT
jgi:excisionase family DNA binding protein